MFSIPVAGCGKTIAAAQKLNRQWIGIDITHLAIGLVRRRLFDAFGDRIKYEVTGEPVSLQGAQQLAREEPYQFQAWALGLVGARPAELKRAPTRASTVASTSTTNPKARSK